MTSTLLSIDEARMRIAEATAPLPAELVPVADAIDRVLCSDVKAHGDVPPFACSAMDGYAVKAGMAGRTLQVVAEARAGAPAELALQDDQAIRISTGAAVPAGAEAVIRQEDVLTREDRIETRVDSVAGAHIREAGEDMLAGTVVLEAGTRLGAAELGAAVAASAGAVPVARRPRVSILCTGDELRAPGERLAPGEIHNSNAVMLAALTRRAGAEVISTATLRDDPAATESALGDALRTAEVVIVAGGVSVGPHDHVKAALQRLQVREHFWGVALQPGRPTWFGTQGPTLVFGLPGNPVSAVVTFTLFAQPALAALQGAVTPPGPRHAATLAVAVRRNPARTQAIRVRLEQADGQLLALPNGPQGSHVVSSLLGADALALIPSGEGELGPGSEVSLEPLLD